ARPKGVRTPIRTPKKNRVQPLHAASERRAAAARRFGKACRGCTPSIGVRPCQTGVQSLHACLEGRAKPARPLDRRAVFACLLAHGYQSTLIRVPKYPYKGTLGTGYPQSTLIRVLRYPYKGYQSTLIRVPKYPYKGYRSTLIRVPKYPYKGTEVPLLPGSRQPFNLRGLRVQSLHACLKGVQALHALQTGVQALHACLAGSHAY
ncbi:hypothetical protein PCANC_26132, partial [Puccinia coronata f. sp. avenae]